MMGNRAIQYRNADSRHWLKRGVARTNVAMLFPGFDGNYCFETKNCFEREHYIACKIDRLA